MFGHNDDDQSQAPVSNEPSNLQPAAAATPATPADPAAANPQDWQHPGAPMGDTASSQISSLDAPAPVDNVIHPSDNVVKSTPTLSSGSDAALAPQELLDLKQQALGQLSPIVGHLDQTPEEKFRTLMMMIQASDDQSLLQEAYATAQAITDEKTKAQALLDVVNEINYFTQQHKS